MAGSKSAVQLCEAMEVAFEAAFSIAAVLARRYGNYPWPQYAAYGLAAAVGFGRSAPRYVIGRFGVLRQ
jgi:hypothetical protein